VPIRKFVLLRTMEGPVVVPRREWSYDGNVLTTNDRPSAPRAFLSGNNHHAEIWCDTKKETWSAEVVSMHEAAQRSRARQGLAVERGEEDGHHFVMSLSEGEVLHMRHRETRELGYFVVAKLSESEGIVFVPHWDARSAGGRINAEGEKVVGSGRSSFALKPSHLKTLGVDPATPPYKVRVDPLGNVTRIEKD